MPAHHGSTPAAWTAVTLVLVGFVVGGAGLILDNWLLFWGGVAVVAAALVVAKLMQVAGIGHS
jgi:hypothetical protein